MEGNSGMLGAIQHAISPGGYSIGFYSWLGIQARKNRFTTPSRSAQHQPE